MDTPPPEDLPPEVPILLPAADLPPMGDTADEQPGGAVFWQPAQSPVRARTILFLSALGAGAVVYIALLIVGGQGGQFAADGIQVLPFVALALFAYAGEERYSFKVLTLIYWAILVGLATAVSVVLTGMSELDVSVLEATNRTGRPPPGGFLGFFYSGGLLKVALSLVGCLIAALVGVWGLTRSGRRTMARTLPSFDFNSFVHAVALATVTALTLILFAPLIVTGEPPFLTVIRHFTGPEFGERGKEIATLLGNSNILVDQVYSFIWLVPMGIVVVGWPLHRTLPSALRRVGLVVPMPWQVAFAVGLAVFLAAAMFALVDPVIGRFWDQMHWPRTDEKTFDQLFKAMNSVLGAYVVGVTAGVGEELFVRGILQPRLGILLSNLFFTSLHALQYNWDALLSVFLVGLVLGMVRKNTNTTTSAIVHGTYDFLLVLAGYYGLDPSHLFGR